MGVYNTTPQVKFGRLNEIRVGDKEWFEWLEQNRHFHITTYAGSFSARKEKRRNGFYWYGVKKVLGRVKKKYLGASGQLTNQALYDVAQQLSAV